MDFQSALQYLYSLTDYEKERIARYDPDTLDLARMRRVLSGLGDPHQRLPAIHIAGTKGKGSVAAMCASVLQAVGLRTGLYTSPHLHTFRERIRVNEELIPPDILAALVHECRPIFDAEPELTTFEAITALAFAHFAQRHIDYAVVEVGLGGRLDATNVITPQVTVITSLSFDHTYLLGNTLAEIAYEKAGIIKPGIPTVCAPQRPEALAVIQEVCAERGSPLTIVGRDWNWEARAAAHPQGPERTLTALGTSDFPLGLNGQSFDLRHAPGASRLDGTYTIPLLGRYQMDNAAAAVAALELAHRPGVALEIPDIQRGLANVRWPGRFEVLQKDPLLVVDCAHNRDSAAKLAAALGEWFPGRRWTFIVGASVDKDVPGMVQELANRAERILATQSRHPRAMSAQGVADIAVQTLARVGSPPIEVIAINDVAAALDFALNGNDSLRAWAASAPPQAAPGEWEYGGPTCVTGSIFAVADAREVWALYSNSDLPDADFPMDLALTPVGQKAPGRVAGHMRSVAA